MSKPNLTTENNLPNAKVVAMTIAGLVVPLYLAAAPMLGLPTFDPEWMLAHLEEIIGGIVAAMFIVGYLKKPGAGDGVVEE